MVEFVLVFPIFFLTLICIIDFSRYLLLRGLLNTAANRAVSQASVVSNLDRDCGIRPSGETLEQCAQARVVAMRTVLQAAGQIPFNTAVAPKKGDGSNYFVGTEEAPAFELILNPRDNWRSFYRTGEEAVDPTSMPGASFNTATPNGPETVRSYLQRNPMEVVLRAEMTSFIPFVNPWVVEARKAGFREIANASSFPPRLDCRGNIVPAGSTGPMNCPCAFNPNDPTVIDGGAGAACLCAGAGMSPQRDPGSGNITSCACLDSDSVFDPSRQSCQRCPARQSVVNGRCECDDPNTSVARDCCPDGTSSSGGICCPVGETGSNGVCCPQGETSSNGQCCPIGLVSNGGVCTCPITSQVLNPESGMCECPPGMASIPGVGECVDCAEYGKVATVGGLCCDAGEVSVQGICCPADRPVNSGGVCCPIGESAAGSGQCCPSSQVFSNGSCRCPGEQSSSSSGQCVCPGELVASGTDCVCPPGRNLTRDGDSCICREGTLLNGFCVTQE